MSIITKKGDAGETSLRYNRRVSKNHPRVEANGCVDELNAALGLARATVPDALVKQLLLEIQRDLIMLMGELAVAEPDRTRFDQDGGRGINSEATVRLEQRAYELEAQLPPLRGWAIPGETLSAAALDLARSVCRRAERAVYALHETNELANLDDLTYLNRLSDLLFLLARQQELTAVGRDASLPRPNPDNKI